MANSRSEFHACLFPMMLRGHTIPFLDMAVLFAKHGATVTIATTCSEASYLSNMVSESGLDIHFHTLTFPSDKAEHSPDDNMVGMLERIISGARSLSPSLEMFLQEQKPNCLVYDMFFPWCVDVGERVGVPTVLFGGTSAICSAIHECIRRYRPHLNVSSDDQPFPITGIPGDIQITRGRLPAPLIHDSPIARILEESKDAETRCHGVLMNSFHDLEGPYVDCLRNQLGRRVWNIGPLSLFKKSVEAERNAKNGRGDHECLKWLDSKKPNSVIYICFGSMVNFTPSQLHEIASALQNSGLKFIWVVRQSKGSKSGGLEWSPQGFEKGVEGRGMVISGWAPQVRILEHRAVGGFVTHCGWNSSLEAISAGVPLVTWPVISEQFFNEILLTQVLKVGVSVGATTWGEKAADISSEAIERAMVRLMVGEEGDAMRNRAWELSSLASKAVHGGSSSSDLRAFIDEFSIL